MRMLIPGGGMTMDDKLDEIRALLAGWRKFLLHPPDAASQQYLAGVRVCADQLDAVLKPEDT